MLYKYFPCDTPESRKRTMAVLEESKVWFANWNTFNDPGEGSYVIDDRGINALARTWVDWDRLYDDFRGRKMALSVLCCSDRYNNSLLWSLYANSHRGICIGFDVLQDTDTDYRISKVAYRDSLPALKPRNLNNESAIKVLLIKGKDYGAEEEIRYIRKSQEGLNRIRVQEITLGLESNGEILDSVRSSKKRGIPIFKCKRSELNTYRLDRELV